MAICFTFEFLRVNVLISFCVYALRMVSRIKSECPSWYDNKWPYDSIKYSLAISNRRNHANDGKTLLKRILQLPITMWFFHWCSPRARSAHSRNILCVREWMQSIAWSKVYLHFLFEGIFFVVPLIFKLTIISAERINCEQFRFSTNWNSIDWKLVELN